MKQKEIKFKQLIWDYDGDKLSKWHYWGFIDGKFIPPEIDGVDPEDNYQSYQYTGLKDSSGREIYEGDIIEWQKGQSKLRGKVYFEEARFWISNYYMQSFDDPSDAFGEGVSTLRVIGNIYQNKNLLK